MNLHLRLETERGSRTIVAVGVAAADAGPIGAVLEALGIAHSFTEERQPLSLARRMRATRAAKKARLTRAERARIAEVNAIEAAAASAPNVTPLKRKAAF